MEKIMDESNSSFSIGFGGANEIDIKELMNSLDGVVGLIDYISTSLENDSFTKIKVKGSREGSFIIDLSVLVQSAATLLTSSNIQFAKLCIETLCDLFKLKQHLKGEKPKNICKNKEGNLIVENKDCENIQIYYNTYNIYTPECDEYMKRTFSSCSNRDSVYIEDNGEKKIEIPKDDFKYMEKEIAVDLNDEKETVLKTNVEIIAGIKKVDFLGSSQWELCYSGKTIKATLEDEEFKFKLHEGNISINSKTNIKIDLETEVFLDKIGQVIKTNYRIKRIIEIYQNDLKETQLKI